MPTNIRPNNIASKKRQNLAQASATASATPLQAPPPKHLSALEAAAWVEIVESVPAGILEKSDVFLIELTARLLALTREAGVNAALAAQLRGALAAIGATPTDRIRLAGLATPPVEKDELDVALGRVPSTPKR